jgi:hypothetical protein
MKDKTPDAFVFMKVGNHAGESFDEIISRKTAEFKKAGRIFWGYGGTSCHPSRQVQPFAKTHLKQSGKIYLLMQSIQSNADPDILPATKYSVDGINWKPIPAGIDVLGSRYALVLGEIKPGDLIFPAEEYVVGIGPSREKIAADYICGHVDKGCFLRKQNALAPKKLKPPIQISYKAELLDPYAVFLRYDK